MYINAIDYITPCGGFLFSFNTYVHIFDVEISL